MSHTRADYRAHATDHAVRRYAERVLGLDLGDLDDQRALSRARAQGVNCVWIRARLAEVGGILLQTGMRDGSVVVPLERMTVHLTRGAVVTVVTPPLRTSRRDRRPAMRRAA